RQLDTAEVWPRSWYRILIEADGQYVVGEQFITKRVQQSRYRRLTRSGISGERRDAAFCHDCTGVQRQHFSLMTQRRPRLSEQEDFNVLCRCSGRWPHANLPAPPDLEVRDTFYFDKGLLWGVLKFKSACTFCHWEMFGGGDLNDDVKISTGVR